MVGLVDKLSGFLKKITGIHWYVIIDSKEKKIIDKSPVLSNEVAEKLIAISNISAELSKEIGKEALLTSSSEAGEALARTIYVKFNGEGLEIESIGDYTVLFDIDKRLLDQVSKVFDKLRRKEELKCKICGKDLLLETYTCPKCGRTIPFTAERCPYCNYNLAVKRCPGHNGYIDLEGNPVKRDLSLLILGTSMGVLTAVFTAFIANIMPEYSLLLYIIGGVLSAIMILFGIYTSSPR